MKLIKIGYFKENKVCGHCKKIMYLKKYNCIDDYHWECRGTLPKRHFSSKSIKINSIFSDIHTPIYILLDIVEKCFIEGYSLQRTFNEVKSWNYEKG